MNTTDASIASSDLLKEMGINETKPFGTSDRAAAGTKRTEWVGVAGAASLIGMSVPHTSDLGRNGTVERRQSENGRWEYSVESLYEYKRKREAASEEERSKSRDDRDDAAEEVPEWLTVGQAADVLGQGPSQVVRFAEAGKIRFKKTKDQPRLYFRDDLAAIREFYAKTGKRRLLISEIPAPKKARTAAPEKAPRGEKARAATVLEEVLSPPPPAASVAPPPPRTRVELTDPKFSAWLHAGVMAGYVDDRLMLQLTVDHLRRWGVHQL